MSNNSRFSRILLRGGTREELRNINPMLKEREPIVEYDTGRMKIGDGINRYNRLRYVGSSGDFITIKTFSIKKCIDSDGNEYTGGNVPKGTTISKTIVSYEITGSPDELIISYKNNDNKTIEILNEIFPDKLSGEIIIDEEISNKFTFKLELKILDKDSITKEISINFYPYIYYGAINISNKEELFNSYQKISNKLITSSANVTYNIVIDDKKYIVFFLPKSIYYNNKGLIPKFQDADAPIGWGGFYQIDCEDGSIMTEFSPNKYINIGNEEYYIYRSTNELTSTKNITVALK